ELTPLGNRFATSDLMAYRISADAALNVQAPGFARRFNLPWKPGTQQSPTDASGPIDLGTIELVAGTEVQGRVVLARALAPVEGATLWLATHPLSYHPLSTAAFWDVGSTESDGSFTLTTRLEPTEAEAPFTLVALAPQGVAWLP